MQNFIRHDLMFWNICYDRWNLLSGEFFTKLLHEKGNIVIKMSDEEFDKICKEMSNHVSLEMYHYNYVKWIVLWRNLASWINITQYNIQICFVLGALCLGTYFISYLKTYFCQYKTFFHWARSTILGKYMKQS